MRRIWIAVGLITVFTSVIVAVSLNNGYFLKPYHFIGTQLRADLNQPDAYIRTKSLSSLPSDLLRVPIAHDVLTEDLAFYYDNHEDRLGVSGAIKRIAYEHDLDWSDKILAGVLNEPAEIALWRDGHGALRHYAIVIKRNVWSKLIQQIATVAVNDTQLTKAGEITTRQGKITLFALEINPHRTFLIMSQRDTLVVLSDPGLLLDNEGNVISEASNTISSWLDSDTLSKKFLLNEASASDKHTLILRSSALAFGYDPFIPGFEGVRFDFGNSWSTSMWINQQKLGNSKLGDYALWKAAPANPSACMVLPLKWDLLHQLLTKAETEDSLPPSNELKTLNGSVLACWYNEAGLYAPVFIIHSESALANRNKSLQTLAEWAIADKKIVEKIFPKDSDAILYSGETNQASIGAKGNYIVFSPNTQLVEKTFDTMSHLYPNVTDQVKTSDATMALLTPKPLSSMIEKEVISAVDDTGDANLLAFTQTHL
ncbi:MAG: DUF2138 family protein, partial [Sulfuricurvum sp.]|nr:DUF2138 family protein [Sulfuricurvum sp.]